MAVLFNTDCQISCLEEMTKPYNWMELRRQWEYSHAVSAVLNLVALATLILSVLARDEKVFSEQGHMTSLAAEQSCGKVKI
jgi:hypothetical protein